MNIILIKAIQLILALCILIIIHEFGHFFFAKIFGIRVEKFFLFFDAGEFKLFSTKSKWFRKLFPSSEKWRQSTDSAGCRWADIARLPE